VCDIGRVAAPGNGKADGGERRFAVRRDHAGFAAAVFRDGEDHAGTGDGGMAG
jgi:hypothetical protein